MGDHMVIDGPSLPETTISTDQTLPMETVNIPFQQVVEPEKMEYSQEELAAFLNDPEEKKNAVSLALQVQQFVGKNWFTFSRFLKKAKENPSSGQFKLKLLVSFGLLQQKLGTWKDGKESRGMVTYKVVISNEDKIIALDEIISFHKDQIESLELQKRNLQAEK
jgi:hypothetical protein